MFAGGSFTIPQPWLAIMTSILGGSYPLSISSGSIQLGFGFGLVVACLESAITLLPPISEVVYEINSPSDKGDLLCPPFPVLGGGWFYLLPPSSVDTGEISSGHFESDTVPVRQAVSRAVSSCEPIVPLCQQLMERYDTFFPGLGGV